jgi:hypothetical protein
MKPLLLLCLLLTSCQTVKDRLDLWFVVPSNPFEQPIQKP